MKISSALVVLALASASSGGADPLSTRPESEGARLLNAGVPRDTVETRVLVHVLAHHAKLIGSSVGGAQVTITEAETGKVLAQGITDGGTGNTDLIMGPQGPLEDVLGQSGGANFRATVRLDRPTRVRVTATGPLAFPQAIESTSKTVLLLPGQDVSGDGIVLELNGLIVEILEPIPGPVSGAEVMVRARVRMLCSCATTPDGIWPSPEVRARLLDSAGAVVAEADLPFAGEASTYQGVLRGVPEGVFDLEVVAVSDDGSNAGTARIPLARD